MKQATNPTHSSRHSSTPFHPSYSDPAMSKVQHKPLLLPTNISFPLLPTPIPSFPESGVSQNPSRPPNHLYFFFLLPLLKPNFKTLTTNSHCPLLPNNPLTTPVTDNPPNNHSSPCRPHSVYTFTLPLPLAPPFPLPLPLLSLLCRLRLLSSIVIVTAPLFSAAAGPLPRPSGLPAAAPDPLRDAYGSVARRETGEGTAAAVDEEEELKV